MFAIQPLEEGLEVDSVYTDGGIIGKNPSEDGGTWAAVFLRGETVVAERSGVVLPEHIGMETVENNIVETIAIMLALEVLPIGWRGTLYGDNLNSIRRARDLKIKDAVPKFIKDRLLAVRATVHPTFVLIGGHPTEAEVAAGVRSDGKMVSKWNVRADKLCCAEAAAYKKGIPTPQPKVTNYAEIARMMLASLYEMATSARKKASEFHMDDPYFEQWSSRAAGLEIAHEELETIFLEEVA